MEEKNILPNLKYVQIEAMDDKDLERIANSIHEQLVGNEDYINSNILLSIDVDAVRLYFFEECKEIPNIII